MTETKSGGISDGTKRKIDPLTERVDPQLTALAADIMALKPNEAYWASVPIPKRPDGRVRFEELRQMATLVVPALGYVAATVAAGWQTALLGLPVYIAVGWLLDAWVTKSIKAQLAKDEDLDRGRYAFTRILGDELGLAPEEVTLEVVRKMNQDFRDLEKSIKAHCATHPETLRNRKKAATGGMGGTDGKGGSSNDHDDNGGHRGTSSNYGGTSSCRDDFEPVDHGRHREDDYQWEPPSPWGGVNPSTGLTMIGGTPIDVQGHTWGTGSTSF